MIAKLPQRPVLPPDPIGDALAACYRQLLAQLAQETSDYLNPMVGVDGAVGEFRVEAVTSVADGTSRIKIKTE